MTTDRRRRGRAIRKARRRAGKSAPFVILRLEADLHEFIRELNRLTGIFTRFTLWPPRPKPRQIIHNGRKP